MEHSFIFLVGVIVGSFLTVCIERLPLRQSIVHPASYCPNCKTTLKMADLIPLISYLFLRGKCRYCKQPYPGRYFLIELMTGSLFVWSFHVLDSALLACDAFLLTAFLIIIAWIDYDYQLILDKVLIWLAVCALLRLIFLPVPELASRLAGACAGGGALFLTGVFSQGGIGGGDVKLAVVLGLWSGFPSILLTLFLAFVSGGMMATALLLCKLKNRKDGIPFAPFLAAGAWISMLYGSQILDWYTSLF
ncbi:hypothetical protein P22_0148 [Propionispora sp. 2/2-37]|uniref:prepilin peptidase n=1 Tax=Propionispora sp. 2/2-37 TaxID=1677858 RepID=UPI0006BB5543|nr:A24 family peptidase [Propionispora sp. 2/2-37]CUH94086.1 hypothetical protein P22_0148 [Propionispora sp. 2/2-37]